MSRKLFMDDDDHLDFSSEVPSAECTENLHKDYHDYMQRNFSQRKYLNSVINVHIDHLVSSRSL
jgi:hypothetical protein